MSKGIIKTLLKKGEIFYKSPFIKKQIGSVPGGLVNYVCVLIYDLVKNTSEWDTSAIIFGNFVQLIISFFVHENWTYIEEKKFSGKWGYYLVGSSVLTIVTILLAWILKTFMPPTLAQIGANSIMIYFNTQFNDRVFKN